MSSLQQIKEIKYRSSIQAEAAWMMRFDEWESDRDDSFAGSQATAEYTNWKKLVLS